MKTKFGKHTRLNQALYRLLRKFVYCLKQCDSTDPRDVAYWYGERSLTALLATSAWLMDDGWSLEEFTGQRSKGKKPKVTPGRGDLWLEIGKHKFTIEAKVTWPAQIADVHKWKGRVNNKLSQAFSQLEHLSKHYRYGVPAAVCYIVPYLSGQQLRQKGATIPRAMKDFIRIITERDPSIAAIAAWHGKLSQVPCDGYGGSKKYYPCIAAVIQTKTQWRFARQSVVKGVSRNGYRLTMKS